MDPPNFPYTCAEIRISGLIVFIEKHGPLAYGTREIDT